MEITDRNKIEEEFHDKWAKTVNAKFVLPEKYFTALTAAEGRYVLSRMGRLKRKKVLDLGCGFSEATVWFALKGAQVVALDISSGMLSCVENLAKRYGVKKQITAIKAVAEKIPLDDESVDLVFGGNILHHTDISAVSKEVRRVLRPNGKAFFIEPLAYNPLVNIYRRMAKDVRTKMEKPFTFKDIDLLGDRFGKVSHKEFQLFTTLIFVWFFLGERLHPSKVRYWKKFIEEGEKYYSVFRMLEKIDRFLLPLPFIRRYCWNTVIELVK